MVRRFDVLFLVQPPNEEFPAEIPIFGVEATDPAEAVAKARKRLGDAPVMRLVSVGSSGNLSGNEILNDEIDRLSRRLWASFLVAQDTPNIQTFESPDPSTIPLLWRELAREALEWVKEEGGNSEGKPPSEAV